MFKSTEKELLAKIDNLTNELDKLKISEEKIQCKVKALDGKLGTNNQTDTLSDLLEQLICNSNENRTIWLFFDYKLLKTAISDSIFDYRDRYRTLSPDIPTCEEVLKALGYPSKNAKYWFDFCLSHKYAWTSIKVNNGVHVNIYDNEPFNKNISRYTLDFKTYLSLSFKKPTETDYEEKYNNLKNKGYEVDDERFQIDRPISDLFYCKQVSVLDLLKSTLKGE